MAAPDQAKLRKRLENLLKLPENQTCADCRKRGPRWASANLGIFICIECSGIHRNLGVHISFVRSVNLDSWTVKQVDFMEEWGNARANAYFEANVPMNVIRPKEGDPVRVVERFIRDKYEHKRFIGPVPPPNGHNHAAEPPKEPERRRSTAAAVPHARPVVPHTAPAAPVLAPAAPKPAEPSLLDFMNDTPAPVAAAAPAQQSMDSFGGFASAPQPPSQGFDAFSSPAPAVHHHVAQPAQPRNDLLDLLSAPAPAAPAQPAPAADFSQAFAGTATAQPPKSNMSADSILSLYSSGRGGLGGPMGQPPMGHHPQAMHHQGNMMHMPPQHHPGAPAFPGQPQMPAPHLHVPHYGNNMLNAYNHPPQPPQNPFMGGPGGMHPGAMNHPGAAPVNPFGHPGGMPMGMGPGMQGQPQGMGMGMGGMGQHMHGTPGGMPGMQSPPQPPANPFPSGFGAWAQQR